MHYITIIWYMRFTIIYYIKFFNHFPIRENLCSRNFWNLSIRENKCSRNPIFLVSRKLLLAKINDLKVHSSGPEVHKSSKFSRRMTIHWQWFWKHLEYASCDRFNWWQTYSYPMSPWMRYPFPYLQGFLAVCDANYCFTLIDIGQYGSNNDSEVLARSEMAKRFEDGTINLTKPTNVEGCRIHCPISYMVGDEIFPLKNWLMRPY